MLLVGVTGVQLPRTIATVSSTTCKLDKLHIPVLFFFGKKKNEKEEEDRDIQIVPQL